MTKTFKITAHGKSFEVDLVFMPSAHETAHAEAFVAKIAAFLQAAAAVSVASMHSDVEGPTSIALADSLFGSMDQARMMEVAAIRAV